MKGTRNQAPRNYKDTTITHILNEHAVLEGAVEGAKDCRDVVVLGARVLQADDHSADLTNKENCSIATNDE